MADKLWKEAISEVLSDAGTSMTPAEIAEAIVSKGLKEKGWCHTSKHGCLFHLYLNV